MKVLIADDEMLQRMLLARFLKLVLRADPWSRTASRPGRSSHAANATSSSRIGSAPPRRHRLIKRIRQAPWPHYVYAIVLTAKEDRGKPPRRPRWRGRRLPLKPCDLDELVARLRIGRAHPRIRGAAAGARLPGISSTGLHQKRRPSSRGGVAVERSTHGRLLYLRPPLDIDRLQGDQSTTTAIPQATRSSGPSPRSSFRDETRRPLREVGPARSPCPPVADSPVRCPARGREDKGKRSRPPGWASPVAGHRLPVRRRCPWRRGGRCELER